MKLDDIPQFIRARNTLSLQWSWLETWLANQDKEVGLDLNPDFQRGHVWTREQQIAYVEYILRGGISGQHVYFNCYGYIWAEHSGRMQCVDGLQRLTAVRLFMANELPVFGLTLLQFEGDPEVNRRRLGNRHCFTAHINKLSRAEVLQWYLDLNDGGTMHTRDELDRVRQLRQQEAV